MLHRSTTVAYLRGLRRRQKTCSYDIISVAEKTIECLFAPCLSIVEIEDGMPGVKVTGTIELHRRRQRT
jgi:hypothetical protein